jgi:hypothetical protein
MTDISDLVTYDEATFKLDIMGKKDSKPVKTGVTFDIRDLNNIDTQKELKRIQHTNMGKRISTQEPLTHEELGRMASAATTEPTDEMLAHCVTGWDWEGKTLGDVDTSKATTENVMAVFTAAPWIRYQVLSKALEITDFTRA